MFTSIFEEVHFTLLTSAVGAVQKVTISFITHVEKDKM